MCRSWSVRVIVHAMVLMGVQLQRDVNDFSRRQFTACAELVVWPGGRQVTASLECLQFLFAVSVLLQSGQPGIILGFSFN